MLPARRRLSMRSSFVHSSAGVPFRRLVPTLPINFEEIFWCAHGNFEDQNKVLESFTIIINYRLMIINTYYDIINAQYDYYISNTALFEECVKKENVQVTVAAATSCLKSRL